MIVGRVVYAGSKLALSNQWKNTALWELCGVAGPVDVEDHCYVPMDRLLELPNIRYQELREGRPVLDFDAADAQMKLAHDLGFLAVCSYGGGVSGLNGYFQDRKQMQAAGFHEYSAFIKAIYTAIQDHASRRGWLPVYWNLADEPIGEDVKRAAENTAAYRQAFPQGPPFFTGASSFSGTNTNDPHFQLAKSLHIVDWNLHDQDGVKLLHAAGSEWAFYNGGTRWDNGVGAGGTGRCGGGGEDHRPVEAGSRRITIDKTEVGGRQARQGCAVRFARVVGRDGQRRLADREGPDDVRDRVVETPGATGEFRGST